MRQYKRQLDRGRLFNLIKLIVNIVSIISIIIFVIFLINLNKIENSQLKFLKDCNKDFINFGDICFKAYVQSISSY